MGLFDTGQNSIPIKFATAADLPYSHADGALVETLDNHKLFVWSLAANDYIAVGTGAGGYTQVTAYADLPSAAAHVGEVYQVLTSTGTWLINRKPAGFYYSNGSTWEAAPDILPYFNAANLEIYDNVDNTKAVKFDVSDIATATDRTINVPNADVDLTPVVNLKNIYSTGLLSGGLLSVNSGDNTKFDLTAGTGVIVDNYTDPLNPTYTIVTWNNMTEMSPQYLASATWESVGVTTGGSLVYKSDDAFSEEESRDIIVLGWVNHVNKINIDNAQTEPIWIVDDILRLDDYLTSNGVFNKSGNVYSASSGLTIKRSAGLTWLRNVNYHNNRKDPNQEPSLLEDPASLFYFYRDGVGGWVNDTVATNNIDPNNYDNNSGTIQPVTAGYWTIQVITFYPQFEANDVQYGQAQYSTLVEAKNNLRNPISMNPYNSWDVPRAWLIVQQGCTDLTDNSKAIFITCGRITVQDLEIGTDSGVGVGEVNTASNIGLAGLGLFDAKIGVDLQFRNLYAGNALSISHDVGNKVIRYDVVTSALTNDFRAVTNDSQLQFTSANSIFAASNHTHGNTPTFNGTNITASFTSASNGLSIAMSAAGGVGGGAAIKGSGTYSQNTGTVEFINANNMTFGLNTNGSMSASFDFINSSNYFLSANATNLVATSQSSLFRHTSQNTQLQFTSANSNFRFTTADTQLQFTSANTNFATYNHSHGNPTLELTNINGTTASNSGGFTLSLSVAAGGAGDGYNSAQFTNSTANSTMPIVWAGNSAGSGNITLGLTGSTVTGSAPTGGAAGITYSIFPIQDGLNVVATGSAVSSAGTQYMFEPCMIEANLSVSNVWMHKSIALSTGTSSNSSGRQSYSYVHSMYIFRRSDYGANSNSLSFYTSASYGFSASRSHTSNSNSFSAAWVTNSTGGTSSWSTSSAGQNFSSYIVGARFIAIPLVTSFSQGEWFIAHRHSSTSATVNSNATLCSFNAYIVSVQSGVGFVLPLLGTNSSLSNPIFGIGWGSASAITTNAAMAASVITNNSSLIAQRGVFVNMGVS